MTIILFIIIFGIVVIAHEFGHFIVARANGIHVVEFSIGMGPNILSFEKGNTKYSIKLLPIGGACLFEGEDGLAVQEGEVNEGAFPNANVWARIATVAAGPIFNFILGFIISLIMVNLVYIRVPVITTVVEDGAAQEVGLQSGDRIVSLNGEKVYLYEELLLFNRVNGGKDVLLVYERDGKQAEVELTPRWSDETQSYLLGISSGEVAEETGVGRLKYAAYEMRYCVKSTYKSLGLLITGQVHKDEVSGPVGIAVNVVGKTYETAKEYGWQNVLVNMMNIVLILSVNLGILNLLPFPALDGGRLVFLFLEVLRGKPIPPEKEGMVHFAGLMFFMLLMIVVLFNDIQNIFGV